LSIYETNNGLSIYQITVRPHFLPTIPNLHNIQSSSSGGKTTLVRQKPQQSHYSYRIANKLVKARHYLLL